MDRPKWTDMHHLLLLAADEGNPLPNLAEPTREERELVAWGLARWDGGAATSSTHHDHAAGIYITPAGLALLAAVESLDGTAAPQNKSEPTAT